MFISKSFLKSLTDHLKILRNYHSKKKAALLLRFSLRKVMAINRAVQYVSFVDVIFLLI